MLSVISKEDYTTMYTPTTQPGTSLLADPRSNIGLALLSRDASVISARQKRKWDVSVGPTTRNQLHLYRKVVLHIRGISMRPGAQSAARWDSKGE